MGNMHKKSIAVVALTKGYEEKENYQDLIARNKSINKYISNQFDNILFHEGNLSLAHQKYIQSFTPEMEIKFINIKTEYPRTAFKDCKNKINNDLCPPTSRSGKFTLGYKHMCHFWFIDFLDYTNDYQYLIRIDEDCFIHKFDNDIVELMDKKNQVFISPYFRKFDVPDVTLGMTKLLKEFVSEHTIKLKNKLEEDHKSVKCPYTNCMLINCEYFRNNDIFRKFQTKVDESSCIYSNRWGDLPLWGLVLWYFEDKYRYEEVRTIGYRHGSHSMTIN
ncbi:MAG: hypothetical protein F6J90_21330 [Moorea sp. SIOASIH]|nr:hypothetical protein [Moorena sp. SIOASIH]